MGSKPSKLSPVAISNNASTPDISKVPSTPSFFQLKNLPVTVNKELRKGVLEFINQLKTIIQKNQEQTDRSLKIMNSIILNKNPHWKDLFGKIFKEY